MSRNLPCFIQINRVTQSLKKKVEVFQVNRVVS